MKRIIVFFLTCVVGNIFGMDVKTANYISSSQEFKFRLSKQQEPDLIAWLEKNAGDSKKVRVIADHYPKDSLYYTQDKVTQLKKAQDGTPKVRCEYTGDAKKLELSEASYAIKGNKEKKKIDGKDVAKTLEKEIAGYPDHLILAKYRTAYQFVDQTSGHTIEIDFDQFIETDILKQAPQSLNPVNFKNHNAHGMYIEIEIKDKKIEADKALPIICNILKNIGFTQYTLWNANLTDMLLNPGHDFSQTITLS